MHLQPPPALWSIPTGDLLKQLETTSQGLGEDEAKARLRLYGANLLKPRKRTDTLTLLLSQFKSPIILILLLAAALSIFLAGYTDAIIIMAIVVISGLLGFWQERGAARGGGKVAGHGAGQRYGTAAGEGP